MKSIMVVVADSSRARIFTTESPSSPLREINAMTHPEGRIHEQKMTSDLPGKDSGQGAGTGGHAYQEKVEPKQQEVIKFAKQAADYLDKARKAHKLEKLMLVAAPAFLGELRNQLPEEVNDCVIFELDKNLTQHSPEDIRAHLPKYLTH